MNTNDNYDENTKRNEDLQNKREERKRARYRFGIQRLLPALKANASDNSKLYLISAHYIRKIEKIEDSEGNHIIYFETDLREDYIYPRKLKTIEEWYHVIGEIAEVMLDDPEPPLEYWLQKFDEFKNYEIIKYNLRN